MTITKDSAAPLVVVVGSTGIQGGSVIRELARSDKPYRIRALTRNSTKSAAQELSKLGAEVYAVDIVVGNEQAVRDAFIGGHIIFVSRMAAFHINRLNSNVPSKIMTNFWEHANMGRVRFPPFTIDVIRVS